MKVTLFGATGFTGSKVLNQLLSNGHSVTVLVRSRSKLNSIADENLKIVEGNVMNEETLLSVIRNQDAVIQCLGIGGKGDGKPNSFVSDATQKIIRIMEGANVKRLISMSNVGAGDSASSQPWFFNAIILPVFLRWLKPILKDKNRMEALIEKSGLNWTTVRFPNITDKPKKAKFQVSINKDRVGFSITNEDAASFLVQQLSESKFHNQSPSVSN